MQIKVMRTCSCMSSNSRRTNLYKYFDLLKMAINQRFCIEVYNDYFFSISSDCIYLRRKNVNVFISCLQDRDVAFSLLFLSKCQISLANFRRDV